MQDGLRIYQSPTCACHSSTYFCMSFLIAALDFVPSAAAAASKSAFRAELIRIFMRLSSVLQDARLFALVLVRAVFIAILFITSLPLLRFISSRTLC